MFKIIFSILQILNPISQYREYKKEAHERAKDVAYRNEIEKEKGKAQIQMMHLENQLIVQDIASKKLDVFHKKFKLLRSLNYSTEEIKSILSENHTTFPESKSNILLDLNNENIYERLLEE